MEADQVARSRRPLDGLVVIDASTIIGAPLTATLLGEYGARVIKLEHPNGGDGARRLGAGPGGEGAWWRFLGKGKECVTCNLSAPEGADLFRKLVQRADVVIENFKPRTMERWGVGFDDLAAINDQLVMLRLSGFGQTGPYSPRPGYGTVAEAFSGLANLTGFPDGPPVLPGVPIADTSTGFAGALAVMIALHDRTAGPQEIDVSLYGSLVYSLGMLFAEYGQTGVPTERRGNRLGNAPRNAWQCSDGRWVAYSGQSPNVVRAMIDFLGVGDDPRFQTIESCLAHGLVIDDLLGAWIAEHTRDEVLEEFVRRGIPIGPVNSIPDVLADKHLAARSEFVVHEAVERPGVEMPHIPFRIRTPESSGTETSSWEGRPLGYDNHRVYVDWLGIDPSELERLRGDGIV